MAVTLRHVMISWIEAMGSTPTSPFVCRGRLRCPGPASLTNVAILIGCPACTLSFVLLSLLVLFFYFEFSGYCVVLGVWLQYFCKRPKSPRLGIQDIPKRPIFVFPHQPQYWLKFPKGQLSWTPSNIIEFISVWYYLEVVKIPLTKRFLIFHIPTIYQYYASQLNDWLITRIDYLRTWK